MMTFCFIVYNYCRIYLLHFTMLSDITEKYAGYLNDILSKCHKNEQNYITSVSV